MSKIHITIVGKFPGLNDYISACRRNPFAGATLKARSQSQIMSQLREQILQLLECPVHFSYVFFETNRKRDKDNVAGMFHKIFQDALVACGYLPNDGWNEISGFSDDFYLAEECSVEITITTIADTGSDPDCPSGQHIARKGNN